MNLKNLVVLIAALFIVTACGSTSTETGEAAGGGGVDKGVKKSQQGFAITPGSSQDLVVNVGDRVFYALNKSNLGSGSRTTLEKQAACFSKVLRAPALKLDLFNA